MSTKISQLTSATDVTANDLIQIVDVEDGVMAPSGTNKKVTASLLAKELAKQPLEPGVVISGSSSSDAVRITQTGTGNALVVEDSTNPDATPFVVNAFGNVGIGTGSPASKLTVNTDTQFDGLVLKNATNTIAYITGNTITNDDGQLSLNSAGVNTATIRANGVSHFNGGDVGIGTSSPLEKLDIAGNIRTIGQVIINAATAAYRFVSFRTNNSTRWDIGVSDDAESGSNAGSDFFLHRFSDASTFLERVVHISRATGNVGIGTSSPSYQLQLSTDSAAKPSTSTWTVSSDERLKENIEAADLDICYNAIKSIPLKRYKWKDEVYSDEQVSDRSKIGWIAQDVQAVFPKAVGQHKFVYNQVKDDDGNIVSEDSIDDCLSLNSDQLYAALFGAVQKLMVTVESLQDKIVQLESGS